MYCISLECAKPCVMKTKVSLLKQILEGHYIAYFPEYDFFETYNFLKLCLKYASFLSVLPCSANTGTTFCSII